MDPMTLPASEMSEVRRSILGIVKRWGSGTIAELADELHVSYEAVRQQITQLHREGWLQKHIDRGGRRPRVGRPLARYRLTPAGDHLFPKHYAGLSVAMMDAVTARFGPEGLTEVLGSLADARVREWLPQLEGLGLEDRLQKLRAIYMADDPFVSVERTRDGGLRLVERNCPFLTVASERPALCSLTVNVLSRLLGRRVVREERFQHGDGRCAFRVLDEARVGETGFQLEPELTGPRKEETAEEAEEETASRPETVST